MKHEGMFKNHIIHPFYLLIIQGKDNKKKSAQENFNTKKKIDINALLIFIFLTDLCFDLYFLVASTWIPKNENHVHFSPCYTWTQKENDINTLLILILLTDLCFDIYFLVAFTWIPKNENHVHFSPCCTLTQKENDINALLIPTF